MNPMLAMKHAHETADEYMNKAVISIDNKFGDGYAKSHPELIAAFMQTSALDYLANYGMEGAD